LDLKNKKEEVHSQQVIFKQETESHVNSWEQVVQGRKRTPTLFVVEEVVQSKLIKECTRHAREMNLKVRGLPSLLTSSNTMQTKASFLWDTLDLLDIGLERA
jgi:hypothetical protein